MVASKNMEIVIALAAIASLFAGAMAQSSCTNAIISLSPCLNYITGNSSTPSSGCCSQLASVVQSEPQCLCQVLNGGASSFGLNINQTQALALPNACNVQTPPVSRCNATSPVGSPSGTPVPISPSGKTNGGTSDGYSNKMTFSLIFTVLFAVHMLQPSQPFELSTF
ncbi:hypothetical protein K2173_018306 [Erythroxylum novogranatense]|uniref:Bifunctional inhibitor/plant lipid transfer protein/seed storage helical domain-containing protein n=1 Tax=Erythroxylum novogranatense TaxID=1862640 RepID=A0AAV8UDM6_9ROSI|nr:hypothetical protein K2173_018306 [Erythroxylum novogranatense]